MNPSDQSIGLGPELAALGPELAALATEQSQTELFDLDSMSTAELVRAMNQEDAKVPAAISTVLPQISMAIEEIAARMAQGGRLVYVGAGTPGRIGVLDASECPPTFGTDPGLVVGILAGGEDALRNAVEDAEDNTVAARDDLAALKLQATDSVVGISASGRTPYVLAAIEAAAAAGAFTVGFSCNEGSPLGSAAELALEVELGPEFLTGSTRLKAGSAQKMVLNMISTIAMVRLGKTYRTLMVDFQASNAKLRARSVRTVSQATGVDLDEAQTALIAAQGSVKTAILMIMTGLPATAAVELLAAHQGNLRETFSDAERTL